MERCGKVGPVLGRHDATVVTAAAAAASSVMGLKGGLHSGDRTQYLAAFANDTPVGLGRVKTRLMGMDPFSA